MNLKEHGFGSADAQIKPEKSFSVTKEKLTLRPDMSVDNSALVKGEISTTPTVQTEMPFGALNKAATDAEVAQYNTTDPASRAKRPTFGEKITPDMKK